MRPQNISKAPIATDEAQGEKCTDTDGTISTFEQYYGRGTTKKGNQIKIDECTNGKILTEYCCLIILLMFSFS